MRRAESNDGLVGLVAARARGFLGGGPRSGRILDAMRDIDRARFLPGTCRGDAWLDEPLPIGLGQTCSQPSLVAFMLDLLDPRPGDRFLEVGSGCGWVAALAARLCGPGGLVYAVEILPELAVAARLSCATCFPGGGFSGPVADGIVFIEGDGSPGLPERAPFDCILLSAGVASPSFREEPLLGQLAPGGRLLYPERRGRLFLVRRSGEGFFRESWNGVAFVPLKGRNA